MRTSRSLMAMTAFTMLGLGLSGCASSGDTPATPARTGAATSFDSLTALRDAFVAAGGECPDWETIDPGEYDAEGGRCSDSVVLSLFHDPAQIPTVVDKAKGLAVPTHLLVGENWILNVENPDRFVDALGGTVVTS